MPVPVPKATPLPDVKRTLADHQQDARTLQALVYDAVEILTDAGALPRENWRFLAHILYCRAVYETHIRPLENRMTFQEIANHLNALGVPRFRGSTAWSASSITDIRQVISSDQNKIMLPDP